MSKQDSTHIPPSYDEWPEWAEDSSFWAGYEKWTDEIERERNDRNYGSQ
jgi:hypothetical protein